MNPGDGAAPGGSPGTGGTGSGPSGASGGEASTGATDSKTPTAAPAGDSGKKDEKIPEQQAEKKLPKQQQSMFLKILIAMLNPKKEPEKQKKSEDLATKILAKTIYNMFKGGKDGKGQSFGEAFSSAVKQTFGIKENKQPQQSAKAKDTDAADSTAEQNPQSDTAEEDKQKEKGKQADGEERTSGAGQGQGGGTGSTGETDGKPVSERARGDSPPKSNDPTKPATTSTSDRDTEQADTSSQVGADGHQASLGDKANASSSTPAMSAGPGGTG
ncbi:MAG: hypothetical protein P1U63_05575 [Coxiellaceae bacterium]|nr:hypothetical protein [Coxiellaceae bacterium]